VRQSLWKAFLDGQVNRAPVCVCGAGYPCRLFRCARFGRGGKGRLLAGLRRRSLLDGFDYPL